MNKGFTLVELIAVITIIGLLAIITTPAYDSISKNIKENNYNSKKNSIKAQTIAYVEKYKKNETYDIGNNGSKEIKTLCFTVEDLIKSGIISSDSEKEEYIENNVTGEKYKNDTYIKVLYDYDLDDLKLVAIIIDDKDKDGNDLKLDIGNSKKTFDEISCS